MESQQGGFVKTGWNLGRGWWRWLCHELYNPDILEILRLIRVYSPDNLKIFTNIRAFFDPAIFMIHLVIRFFNPDILVVCPIIRSFSALTILRLEKLTGLLTLLFLRFSKMAGFRLKLEQDSTIFSKGPNVPGPCFHHLTERPYFPEIPVLHGLYNWEETMSIFIISRGSKTDLRLK